MPPKTQISRQNLQDTAFEIVRKEGIDSLSARRIAQELGCSTQPVYTACGSMASVKAEVEARTKDFIEHFLSGSDTDDPPFLQLGLATLRLARDEPHLFTIAGDFMRDRADQPPPAPVLAAMRADPRLAAMTIEQLTQVNALMCFFSLGLTTTVGPGTPTHAMAAAQAHLRTAGEAVVEFVSKKSTTQR